MIIIKIKRRVKSEPKKQFALFFIILIVIVVGFLFTLNYFLNKKDSYKTTATSQGESLLFTMKMDKEKYGFGEPLGFKMEIRNVGYKPIMLKFDESLEYDVLVQKEKKFLFLEVPFDVWRYSGLKGSLPEKHTVTLQPQEARVYIAKWNQTDHNGKQVEPGNYVIKGIINMAGKSTELQLRGGMSK